MKSNTSFLKKVKNNDISNIKELNSRIVAGPPDQNTVFKNIGFFFEFGVRVQVYVYRTNATFNVFGCPL